MVRITNNISMFNRKVLSNNEKCKKELSEFLLRKLNSYTSVRSGFLRSRNKVDIKQNSVVLSNDSHYAGFLEYGTRKMRPYPFMRPAANNHLHEIRAIVIKNFKIG